MIRIGEVKNAFHEPGDPAPVRAAESLLVIDREWEEGLEGLEPGCFLDVLYLFHLEDRTELRTTNYRGEEKGIFATRSPVRPSHLGLSTVMLRERKDNVLRVIGLDALNGSPVVDIKPSDRFFDPGELRVIAGRGAEQAGTDPS